MMNRMLPAIRTSAIPLTASVLFFSGGVIAAFFSDHFVSSASYNGSSGAVELLKNNAIACLFLAAGFLPLG